MKHLAAPLRAVSEEAGTEAGESAVLDPALQPHWRRLARHFPDEPLVRLWWAQAERPWLAERWWSPLDRARRLTGELSLALLTERPIAGPRPMDAGDEWQAMEAVGWALPCAWPRVRLDWQGRARSSWGLVLVDAAGSVVVMQVDAEGAVELAQARLPELAPFDIVRRRELLEWRQLGTASLTADAEGWRSGCLVVEDGVALLGDAAGAERGRWAEVALEGVCFVHLVGGPVRLRQLSARCLPERVLAVDAAAPWQRLRGPGVQVLDEAASQAAVQAIVDDAERRMPLIDPETGDAVQ